MAVTYDRAARTFIVTMSSESRVVVREHRAPLIQRRCAPERYSRRALREGGREVMNVIWSARPRMLSFSQIRSALPHVSTNTLKFRVSSMVSRGDIRRVDQFGCNRYGIGSSTAAST